MEIGNYKLKFSWIGMVAVVLPMLPNVLWAILPAIQNGMGDNAAPNGWIEGIMKSSQIVMILLLMFVTHKEGVRVKHFKGLGLLTAICLVIYLVSWGVYFLGTITPLLLVGMAVFPCLYFMGIALIMSNQPALWCAILFAVCHISITAWNYL